MDSSKNPSPKSLVVEQGGGRAGWRKDVLDVVKRDGELEIPMLRWPGGKLPVRSLMKWIKGEQSRRKVKS